MDSNTSLSNRCCTIRRNPGCSVCKTSGDFERRDDIDARAPDAPPGRVRADDMLSNKLSDVILSSIAHLFPDYVGGGVMRMKSSVMLQAFIPGTRSIAIQKDFRETFLDFNTSMTDTIELTRGSTDNNIKRQ